jgi:hypothetical protein
MLNATRSWLGRFKRRVLRSLLLRPPLKQGQRRKKMIWSIGLYEGTSLANLAPAAGIQNPILDAGAVTDVRAECVADPFVIREAERWYMFFEVLRDDTQRGEIAVAISEDGVRWKYERIVLAEVFHLSYPLVFKQGDDLFMVPECGDSESVRLYQAVRFPYEWRLAQELISGRRCLDSTLFDHQGKWWLFTETDPDRKYQELSLYESATLWGPWREHARSPIIRNDRSKARPAGRVWSNGQELIRFGQDCGPAYGSRIRAFRITHLSPDGYAETEVPVSSELRGSERGWNAAGMHHIDIHQTADGRLRAYVDGWYPRWV